MSCRLVCFFILIATAVVLTTGCASSSQSQRYNTPSSDKNEPRDKSTRFTSADDDEILTESGDSDDSVYNNYSSSNDEFDEYPVEEIPVDKSEYIESIKGETNYSVSFSPKEKLLAEVITLLDTPYKYGGTTNNGIDCSAFTQIVFAKSVLLKLPRTASQQYKTGEKISTIENLKFGDLIFFNTTRRVYPGHVGIFLGENLFAHASRSNGVVVSNLKNKYYQKRFVGGRRIKDFDK